LKQRTRLYQHEPTELYGAIAVRSCTTAWAQTRAFVPGTQKHGQGFA